MKKLNNDNYSNEVSQSLGSLYSELLMKRQSRKEEKIAEKKAMEETQKLKENEEVTTEDRPMTKKEKRQAALDSWKDVISGLTGDDLEYIKPKKGRKKYKQWIDEDVNGSIVVSKPKKRKKKNYNKEFEQELSMLKNIVSDQNKFTVDLSKRFQTMVGPNTRDAGPISKTAVELASAVNASRSNSLSMIREIGNIKKTIAELTLKELKELGKGGEGFDTTDMTLLGSNIASGFINSPPLSQNDPAVNVQAAQQGYAPGPVVINEFDPDSWTGNGSVNEYTKYEKTSTKTVIELNQSDDKYRYKTYDNTTGEEISDFPNPTFEIKSMDLNNKMARDSFDNIYELEII